MTSIVIPAVSLKPEHYTYIDNLLSCIDDSFPTIVCHDSTEENFRDFIIDKYPKVINLYNDGNRKNFCGNANIGLRYCRDVLKDHAILCNQDMLLPTFGYLDLMRCEGLAFATTVEADNLNKANEEWLNLGVDLFENVPYTALKGFCYFISHKVLEEIGVLDERYEAGFDDDDYIVRALLAGFPVLLSKVRVRHFGSHIDQTKTGESMTGAYQVKDLGHKLDRYKFS